MNIRSATTVLFLSSILFIFSGCTTAPSTSQPFPLLNAALTNAPPPGLQAELRAAQERLAQQQGQVEMAVSNTVAPNTAAPAEAEAGEAASSEPAPTQPPTPEPAAPTATPAPAKEEAAPAEAAPTEAAAPATEAAQAEAPTVTIRNARVNIRRGPGLNYQVLTTAPQGTTFTVLGRSPDHGWWRICCIQGPGDAEGEATSPAWVSNVVVTANQAAQDAPDFVLLPDDLHAQWAADYQCDSERCAVPACTATVNIDVRSVRDKWLELDRTITWDGDCGEDASVLHQVDRFTGEERNRLPGRPFAFDYWLGANPGPATQTHRLDGREIQVSCQEGLSGEAEEGDGWTTVYDGSGCYDVRTGMVVTLHYTKRWLFSGEYEGQSYDRAFFGDVETYDLQLVDTNVELSSAGK